jgi:hypothetical protein
LVRGIDQRTLTAMVRAMFPHPSFPDGPYERTAAAIAATAKTDVRLRAQLRQGLRELEEAGGKPFAELDPAAALAVLGRMSASTFFQAVRGQTILTLYNDREVWSVLGYEGSAFEQGGYIDRGFADLDWLPEPRIEEAT